MLYEIAAAFAENANAEWGLCEEPKAASERAIAFYRRTNEEAKRAVLCWLWLVEEKRVVKDIRLLIANLVWEERAAWSERPAVANVPLRRSGRSKKPRV